MLRFSANLGFLWRELSLTNAIKAAAAAGFDAVECHWPYDTPANEVQSVLNEMGLPMLGLNTPLGDAGADDFGLAAVPGRTLEARRLIDEAVAYADAIGCANIHVMSGKTDSGAVAETTFRENLRYACDCAGPRGIAILIEPINHRDVPGYHLSTVEQAMETIAAVRRDNISLMFDCYHVQIMQGDLTRRISDYANAIGHVQIASVPDRAEPNGGEVNYLHILSALSQAGYGGHIGAEYKPRTTTNDGLTWLKEFRSL